MRKITGIFVFVAFIVNTVMPSVGMAQVLNTGIVLPTPGTMVFVSPSFTPALIKGLTIHKDNPFLFDFIVDPGESTLSPEALKDQSERMIHYFFAALTLPDKDVWVNLSPYEKDRIIPSSLGETVMGRDLLAQDYMLKQLTASLIYPQKDLGKAFWAKVYSKAQEMYGTTQVPVNTFNKVWIVPQKVGIYEHGQTAFILEGHLKVMLEADYLSMTKHNAIANPDAKVPAAGINQLGSQIIRQIVLPEIEKEVNEGRNFATLRQIFYAQALAVWFKNNLKEALLNRVYANKGTVKGIDQNDAAANEAIYERYLKAYKKGVFNYIKEDIDPITQEILPRKYFSGGYTEQDLAQAVVLEQPTAGEADAATAAHLIDVQAVTMTHGFGDAAVLAQNADKAMNTTRRQMLLNVLTIGLPIAGVAAGIYVLGNINGENSELIKERLRNLSYLSGGRNINTYAAYPLRRAQSVQSVREMIGGDARFQDFVLRGNAFPATGNIRSGEILIVPDRVMTRSNAVRFKNQPVSYLKEIIFGNPNDTRPVVLQDSDSNAYVLVDGKTLPEGNYVIATIVTPAENEAFEGRYNRFFGYSSDFEDYYVKRLKEKDSQNKAMLGAKPGTVMRIGQVGTLHELLHAPSSPNIGREVVRSQSLGGHEFKVWPNSVPYSNDPLKRARLSYENLNRVIDITGMSAADRQSVLEYLYTIIQPDMTVSEWEKAVDATVGGEFVNGVYFQIVANGPWYLLGEHGQAGAENFAVIKLSRTPHLEGTLPNLTPIYTGLANLAINGRTVSVIAAGVNPEKAGSESTYKMTIPDAAMNANQPRLHDLTHHRLRGLSASGRVDQVAPAIKQNPQAQVEGGIDLSQQDAALRVTKDTDGGVKVDVDPALIARVEQEGLPEVVPVIVDMKPADMQALFQG